MAQTAARSGSAAAGKPPLLDPGRQPRLTSLVASLGDAFIMAGRAFQALFTGKVAFRDVLAQMRSIGVESVWIVVLITASTGAVFAYYTVTLAQEIGVTGFVGGTLAYVMLNELGPSLTGTGVASRAGAAIAAEIGSMVVTEQVDALRAMAVSPVRYLVAPRLVAAVLMMPLLTVFGDGAGIFGGYVLARVAGMPGGVYWDSVYTYAGASDLMHGLVKALVFGLLISVVACFVGLRTTGGATGVGRATTRSVVLCVVLIFASNFFLTQMLTHPHLTK